MAEVPCPNCAGCGSKVVPVPVEDYKTGQINIVQRAEPCTVCFGNKTIDDGK